LVCLDEKELSNNRGALERKNMAEQDTAIDPKPIISLMFAISVGFWASQLVQYVSPTSEHERSRSAAKEL
jgi:hypothetical protein